MKQKPQSAECFYLDADGERSDADIHDAILAEGTIPESSREAIRQYAKKQGITDERRRELWGF